MSSAAKKSQIRDAIRTRRAMLEDKQIKEYADILAEQFIDTDDKELRKIIGSAQTVAVYSAVRGELPCDGITKFFTDQGRTVCFPKVKGDEMEFYEITDMDSQMTTGAYSIPEPKGNTRKIYPQDIDIMIVPAIAYNDEGLRLGQGGGYYDRYLNQAEAKGKIPYTIGVCYDFQIYSALPVEPHDRAVDCIMCVYTGDDE